mgnify:CR=1 FL=1
MAIDLVQPLWLPAGAPLVFHPLTIAAAVAVAALGEVLELTLSAAGARRFGASRAGMFGSVLGGVLGALVGTCAIPLPVLGTIAGALIVERLLIVVAGGEAERVERRAQKRRRLVRRATGLGGTRGAEPGSRRVREGDGGRSRVGARRRRLGGPQQFVGPVLSVPYTIPAPPPVNRLTPQSPQGEAEPVM